MLPLYIYLRRRRMQVKHIVIIVVWLLLLIQIFSKHKSELHHHRVKRELELPKTCVALFLVLHFRVPNEIFILESSRLDIKHDLASYTNTSKEYIFLDDKITHNGLPQSMQNQSFYIRGSDDSNGECGYVWGFDSKNHEVMYDTCAEKNLNNSWKFCKLSQSTMKDLSSHNFADVDEYCRPNLAAAWPLGDIFKCVSNKSNDVTKWVTSARSLDDDLMKGRISQVIGHPINAWQVLGLVVEYDKDLLHGGFHLMSTTEASMDKTTGIQATSKSPHPYDDTSVTAANEQDGSRFMFDRPTTISTTMKPTTLHNAEETTSMLTIHVTTEQEVKIVTTKSAEEESYTFNEEEYMKMLRKVYPDFFPPTTRNMVFTTDTNFHHPTRNEYEDEGMPSGMEPNADVAPVSFRTLSVPSPNDDLATTASDMNSDLFSLQELIYRIYGIVVGNFPRPLTSLLSDIHNATDHTHVTLPWQYQDTAESTNHLDQVSTDHASSEKHSESDVIQPATQLINPLESYKSTSFLTSRMKSVTQGVEETTTAVPKPDVTADQLLEWHSGDGSVNPLYTFEYSTTPMNSYVSFETDQIKVENAPDLADAQSVHGTPAYLESKSKRPDAYSDAVSMSGLMSANVDLITISLANNLDMTATADPEHDSSDFHYYNKKGTVEPSLKFTSTSKKKISTSNVETVAIKDVELSKSTSSSNQGSLYGSTMNLPFEGTEHNQPLHISETHHSTQNNPTFDRQTTIGQLDSLQSKMGNMFYATSSNRQIDGIDLQTKTAPPTVYLQNYKPSRGLDLSSTEEVLSSDAVSQHYSSTTQGVLVSTSIPVTQFSTHYSESNGISIINHERITTSHLPLEYDLEAQSAKPTVHGHLYAIQGSTPKFEDRTDPSFDALQASTATIIDASVHGRDDSFMQSTLTSTIAKELTDPSKIFTSHTKVMSDGSIDEKPHQSQASSKQVDVVSAYSLATDMNPEIRTTTRQNLVIGAEASETTEAGEISYSSKERDISQSSEEISHASLSTPLVKDFTNNSSRSSTAINANSETSISGESILPQQKFTTSISEPVTGKATSDKFNIKPTSPVIIYDITLPTNWETAMNTIVTTASLYADEDPRMNSDSDEIAMIHDYGKQTAAIATSVVPEHSTDSYDRFAQISKDATPSTGGAIEESNTVVDITESFHEAVGSEKTNFAGDEPKNDVVTFPTKFLLDQSIPTNSNAFDERIPYGTARSSKAVGAESNSQPPTVNTSTVKSSINNLGDKYSPTEGKLSGHVAQSAQASYSTDGTTQFNSDKLPQTIISANLVSTDSTMEIFQNNDGSYTTESAGKGNGTNVVTMTPKGLEANDTSSISPSETEPVELVHGNVSDEVYSNTEMLPTYPGQSQYIRATSELSLSGDANVHFTSQVELPRPTTSEIISSSAQHVPTVHVTSSIPPTFSLPSISNEVVSTSKEVNFKPYDTNDTMTSKPNSYTVRDPGINSSNRVDTTQDGIHSTPSSSTSKFTVTPVPSADFSSFRTYAHSTSMDQAYVTPSTIVALTQDKLHYTTLSSEELITSSSGEKGHLAPASSSQAIPSISSLTASTDSILSASIKDDTMDVDVHSTSRISSPITFATYNELDNSLQPTATEPFAQISDVTGHGDLDHEVHSPIGSTVPVIGTVYTSSTPVVTIGTFLTPQSNPQVLSTMLQDQSNTSKSTVIGATGHAMNIPATVVADDSMQSTTEIMSGTTTSKPEKSLSAIPSQHTDSSTPVGHTISHTMSTTEVVSTAILNGREKSSTTASSYTDGASWTGLHVQHSSSTHFSLPSDGSFVATQATTGENRKSPLLATSSDYQSYMTTKITSTSDSSTISPINKVAINDIIKQPATPMPSTNILVKTTITRDDFTEQNILDASTMDSVTNIHVEATKPIGVTTEDVLSAEPTEAFSATQITQHHSTSVYDTDLVSASTSLRKTGVVTEVASAYVGQLFRYPLPYFLANSDVDRSSLQVDLKSVKSLRPLDTQLLTDDWLQYCKVLDSLCGLPISTNSSDISQTVTYEVHTKTHSAYDKISQILTLHISLYTQPQDVHEYLITTLLDVKADNGKGVSKIHSEYPMTFVTKLSSYLSLFIPTINVFSINIHDFHIVQKRRRKRSASYKINIDWSIDGKDFVQFNESVKDLIWTNGTLETNHDFFMAMLPEMIVSRSSITSNLDESMAMFGPKVQSPLTHSSSAGLSQVLFPVLIGVFGLVSCIALLAIRCRKRPTFFFISQYLDRTYDRRKPVFLDEEVNVDYFRPSKAKILEQSGQGPVSGSGYNNLRCNESMSEESSIMCDDEEDGSYSFNDFSFIIGNRGN